MITCKLSGGLGNQIFQIFATISLAIKNNQAFYFLNVKGFDGNGVIPYRKTYFDTFFKNLKLLDNYVESNTINEVNFNYNNIQINSENTLLDGYFQSYKYFQEHYLTICNILNIKKPIFDGQSTASIHFRIGDYKYLQNCHPVLPLTYYENAVNFIASKINKILFFCEDENIQEVMDIIDKLSISFKNITFVKAPSLIDYEEMLLMSCCEHNIIANSTFSWWGAYLNQCPNKIVCYPSTWFGPSLSCHNLDDLFPNEWVKINC